MTISVFASSRDLFLWIKLSASANDKRTFLALIQKWIDPRMTKELASRFEKAGEEGYGMSYDIEGRNFPFTKQQALNKLAGKMEDDTCYELHTGRGSATWRSKGFVVVEKE